ncbi:MAG: nucleocapsid protein [Frankliniella intonsa rhabdovirus 1]|uniref:Nucleoprotein n=1 Tax=Frankliniella intonsa rhabdovirus 1 TaxID=3070917 RepID=A0A8K1XB99_9RHAB|nr:MAG: nucleocapsid protein [Frankliniella intonsa rhabdovirus 1]UHK03322.1 MAG: nucleocapsid protein [Frankliniella intonsa rhabdovirus 1]
MPGFKFGDTTIETPAIGGDVGGEYPGPALVSGKPKVCCYGGNRSLYELGGFTKHLVASETGGDPKLITTFLVSWCREIKFTAPTDWKSYGITIAQADTEVTPLSLVDLSQEGEMAASAQGGISLRNDHEVNCLALVLLAGARVANAPDVHKEVIKAKIEGVANVYPTEGWDFRSMISRFSMWAADMNYRKIVAAVDMFFSKYSTHTFSVFRVATLVARYNQCSALSSCMYLWGICGSDAEKMVGFMWDLGVVKEVVKLYKPEEEFHIPDSYLPYGSFFGLVNRSAYSAACNPRFTVFTHVIGTLMLNQRSINAYFDTGVLSPGILTNGITVAYMVFHTMNFRIHAYDEADNAEAVKGVNDMLAEQEEVEVRLIRQAGETEDEYRARVAEEQLKKIPTTQDYKAWIKCIDANGRSLPPVILNWAREQASKIVNPRPSTVGFQIATMYGGL